MSPGRSVSSVDATAEIGALIETLHETGRRLEELTAGEVDTVADREGQTFVLRRAQEYLRHAEAAKQAAILDALPAHIALLDAHGLIVSTNEAWRSFTGANPLQAPGHAVGLNYLEVCDQARGDDVAKAQQAAAGIRAVLAGTTTSFSLEYPCHSPAEQRWFLMTVAPVLQDRATGAVVMHLNITAQRRAEQGRLDSELLFRQMAENIHEVFFLLEASTNRMLYISPAYEEIWGRTCKSLYEHPESWTQSIHPDDQASTREKYKAGLAMKKFEYEYRMVRPDGTVRQMEIRGSPVRNETGKVTRITGIVTDITARKDAEQALVNSEIRLRALIENSSDVIAITDSNGRVTYVSPSIHTVAGYTPEEMVGRNFLEPMHPDDRTAATVRFEELLGVPGAVQRHERRYRRKDGSWMESENVTVNLIHVPAVAGVVTTMRDVTARNRAAEELRRNESLKSAILESSLDCIVTLDDQGRIVEFNAAAEKTLGLPRTQALGQAMVDLFVPLRFREAHRKDFAHYMATGEGWLVGKRLELLAIRPDGSEFPIELAVTAIHGMAKPMFTGFIRDITERKQAARTLHESQRRFSDMLDNVELISLMLDANANITYCNDYFLRLTGWSLEEVIGRNWFDTFVPAAASDIKPAFAALLDDRPEPRHRNDEILLRSGERRLIRWSNTVLRSGAGDVIGSASIGEDITDRKQAEEVLLKRTAELERFHRLSVGRELQMIELKKRVNELARQAGQQPPYDLAFVSSRIVKADSDHEHTP